MSTNFFSLVQSCSLPFYIYVYSSCVSNLYDLKSSIIIIIDMISMFLFVMKNQSFAEWRKCFHIDNEWHLAAVTVTVAPCSVSLVFVYLQLLRQLNDPDLLKSVLLFKGGLTTLWLMCLVWFKHSSPTSTLSWSCADAGLLLHNPDARLGDAAPSIIAPLLRITPHWGGETPGDLASARKWTLLEYSLPLAW